jgi:transposase
MARPLSEDLRSRLVAAVNGGMSRRAAAERFGVAVARAVRWVQAWRATGAIGAKPHGGDKRSHRIEAEARASEYAVMFSLLTNWKWACW